MLSLFITYSSPDSDAQKVISKDPILIQEQGSFAIGGTVITNPGTFDSKNPTPEGQTLHGDHAYVFYQIPVKARKYPQTRFNTDKVWAEPARFVASTIASNGNQAYIFLFSYVPPSMKARMPFGPGHGTDISFAFDNLGERSFGPPPPPPTSEDKAVAKLMNAYWVNFAKTGNPNGDGLPEWPLYTPKTNKILDFQPDGQAVGKSDPRKARLDVIEKAVNKGDKLQPNGI